MAVIYDINGNPLRVGYISTLNYPCRLDNTTKSFLTPDCFVRYKNYLEDAEDLSNIVFQSGCYFTTYLIGSTSYYRLIVPNSVYEKWVAASLPTINMIRLNNNEYYYATLSTIRNNGSIRAIYWPDTEALYFFSGDTLSHIEVSNNEILEISTEQSQFTSYIYNYATSGIRDHRFAFRTVYGNYIQPVGWSNSSLHRSFIQSRTGTEYQTYSDGITTEGYNENNMIINNILFSDLFSQPDIYSPGGTTDTPHNPYPAGTIVPNDTGNTTSQNTSGTWTLPFDDISTDHADVQSVDTGLYRMFGMTKLQMQALANALFTSPSEIGENLVKLIFGSPLEAIISCMEYPFEVSPFGMDNIHFIWDTDGAFPAVNGKALSSEYLKVDFGTITVNRYSGTFYDFEPYTTAELYIPYIGFVPLTPTEIMGATLEIKGWVHLATGEMCIFVKSSTAGIIGTYTTIVGRQLPISSYDFREMYAAIIKTAAVAATGIAAGVNAIPGILAANRNQVKAYDKLQEAIGKGGRYPVGALSHYRATERATDKAITNFANVMSEATADTTASAITAVATGSSVSRNNSFTSGSGRCSPQDCFLRLTYPHQNVPANQNLLAYPVNADGPLSRSDLHGYTVVRTIHLQGIPATSEEIGELEQLLMGGVWLP